MVYIPPEKVEEIQAKSNIVEYIGQYVSLKKTGSDYSGLCPFHHEKTPSFHVSEEKQVFHCFGCGKKGNLFQFIQQYQHVGFLEAVQEVARFIHESLEITTTVTHNSSQFSQRTKFYDWHQKAAEIYHYVLMHTKEGRVAREYLQQRGIDTKTMEHFQLGYAPKLQGNDFLFPLLKNEELKESDYEDSGLFQMDRSGNYHDRFFDRLMIPILDLQQHVVGFSGRSIHSELEPKYLNTNETLIFKKSELLFHYQEAKSNLSPESPLLLMEGYMDVMQAWRQGIPQAIASMGTSLSATQIQAIQKCGDILILCFDGDRAGWNATYKALDQLWGKIKELRVAIFPENLDPDEFLREKGKEAFEHFLHTQTLSAFSFLLQYFKKDLNLQQTKSKLQYIEEILQFLAPKTDRLEAEFYLQRLSVELQIDETLLQQKFLSYQRKEIISKPTKKRYNNRETISFPKQNKNHVTLSIQEKGKWQDKQKEIAMKCLLQRAFYFSEVRDYLSEKEFYFADSKYAQLYTFMEMFFQHYESHNIEPFLSYLPTEEMKTLFSDVLAQPLNLDWQYEEIDDYLACLTENNLQALIREKQFAMNEAKEKGDTAQMKQLSLEIIHLLRQQ